MLFRSPRLSAPARSCQPESSKGLVFARLRELLDDDAAFSLAADEDRTHESRCPFRFSVGERGRLSQHPGGLSSRCRALVRGIIDEGEQQPQTYFGSRMNWAVLRVKLSVTYAVRATYGGIFLFQGARPSRVPQCVRLTTTNPAKLCLSDTGGPPPR